MGHFRLVHWMYTVVRRHKPILSDLDSITAIHVEIVWITSAAMVGSTDIPSHPILQAKMAPVRLALAEKWAFLAWVYWV